MAAFWKNRLLFRARLTRAAKAGRLDEEMEAIEKRGLAFIRELWGPIRWARPVRPLPPLSRKGRAKSRNAR